MTPAQPNKIGVRPTREKERVARDVGENDMHITALLQFFAVFSHLEQDLICDCVDVFEILIACIHRAQPRDAAISESRPLCRTVTILQCSFAAQVRSGGTILYFMAVLFVTRSIASIVRNAEV